MSVMSAIEALKQAASSTEPETLNAAKALADAVIVSNDRSYGDLQKGIRQLRGMRAHRAVILAAQALDLIGVQPAWLMRFHAQALIEQGAYGAALGLLSETRKAALAAGDTETETDSWGLEGRVYKDLYRLASTRSPPAEWSVREGFLKKSATAYGWGYARRKGTRDAHFFGGNLLALTAMGQRDGIVLALKTAPNEIAAGIVAGVQKLIEDHPRPDDPNAATAWDYGSAAEAHAHLGRWDEAKAMIGAFLTAPHCDAFSINSTLRQFEQVWGVSPHDEDKAEITNLLRLALMTADGGSIRLEGNTQIGLLSAHAKSGGDVQTRDAQERYEKVFGKEGPYGIGRLREIIELSSAVGRVMINTSRKRDHTIGTGFLLPGASVHASFDGELLFFTNAHVISPNPADGPGAGPGEARIRFDAAPVDIDLPLDDLVWTSPPKEHDASVFRLDRGAGAHQELLGRARRMVMPKGLPKLKQRETVPLPGGGSRSVERATTVYVIGYPLGGDLSFSLSDNELVDYENVYGVEPGPEPRKLHYLAPTEPGNSGSPVFNSRTMELIAIHHAGGNRKRLNGQPGTYDANEGLWMRPLLNALRLAKGLT